MFGNEISKWLADHELYAAIGECGFGRPCVGVMYMKTCNWVGYRDCDVAQASRPEDAYHKDDYLCVLVRNDDYQKAIVQLDAWLSAILKGPHRVVDQKETESVASLLHGGSVDVKSLVNA